jgi:hypothetical protein
LSTSQGVLLWAFAALGAYAIWLHLFSGLLPVPK